MSGRLVGETIDWLQTPAAAGLSTTERCILMVVAERARERDRLMLRHRTDDKSLLERIAEATGLDKGEALKKAFQRLSKAGLEVRIPIGEDRSGRPRFAHVGRSMGFRLPEFPASIQLPERGESVPPSDPVDNPLNDLAEGGGEGGTSSRLSAERGEVVPGSRGERGESVPPLSTSKGSTSKDSPSSGLLESLAELEGPGAARDDDEKPIDQESLRSAQATLLAVPDGPELIARAAAAAPGAGHDRHLINAARLATRRTA